MRVHTNNDDDDDDDDNDILHTYREPMFSHLPVPILLCRNVPCCQFSPLSFHLLIPASTNF